MLDHDLELLVQAAYDSGKIANRFFQADPQVWHKDDNQGPVTEADLAVNAILTEKLRKARPDYGWLSEETEDTTERLSATHVFIVDPIDGTRAFIQGAKDWSHSLAIARDGQITAAAVYLPCRDQMFAAALGKGATLNGTPIKVSNTSDLNGATVLGAKPNFADEYWTDGTPPVERHFRSSLAYRLALVAQGRFDAMVTLRPAWEWDIAAGDLIVTEAGGLVTDRMGAPLCFNNSEPLLNGVVAAGGLHKPLVGALARPSKS